MKYENIIKIYEKYRNRFYLKVKNRYGYWVEVSYTDYVSFYKDLPARLYPVIPFNLPNPNKDMINNAVYIGNGPAKSPHGDIAGWYSKNGIGPWKYIIARADVESYSDHICVSLDDEDAEEIIKLNTFTYKPKPEPDNDWIELTNCEFQYFSDGKWWNCEPATAILAAHSVGEHNVRVKAKND